MSSSQTLTADETGRTGLRPVKEVTDSRSRSSCAEEAEAAMLQRCDLESAAGTHADDGSGMNGGADSTPTAGESKDADTVPCQDDASTAYRSRCMSYVLTATEAALLCQRGRCTSSSCHALHVRLGPREGGQMTRANLPDSMMLSSHGTDNATGAVAMEANADLGLAADIAWRDDKGVSRSAGPCSHGSATLAGCTAGMVEMAGKGGCRMPRAWPLGSTSSGGRRREADDATAGLRREMPSGRSMHACGDGPLAVDVGGTEPGLEPADRLAGSVYSASAVAECHSWHTAGVDGTASSCAAVDFGRGTSRNNALPASL